MTPLFESLATVSGSRWQSWPALLPLVQRSLHKGISRRVGVSTRKIDKLINKEKGCRFQGSSRLKTSIKQWDHQNLKRPSGVENHYASGLGNLAQPSTAIQAASLDPERFGAPRQNWELGNQSQPLQRLSVAIHHASLDGIFHSLPQQLDGIPAGRHRNTGSFGPPIKPQPRTYTGYTVRGS